MSEDLNRAKARLAEGDCTLAVCRGEQMYTDTRRGVAPLLAMLDSGKDFSGFSFFMNRTVRLGEYCSIRTKGEVLVKICLTAAISVVVAAVLLAFLPVHGEEAVYDSVIRIHILAVSDREEDQAVKLAVRDHVLEMVTPVLEEAKTCAEAEGILRLHLDTLEKDTAAWLAEEGLSVPVRMLLAEEEYPTRSYDGFMLPAGAYLSLRVVLGEGEGQNWWCVLFPSVCGRFAAADTREAYIEAGFTPEQYRLITHTERGTYQIRFRLLEILEAWFSRNG